MLGAKSEGKAHWSKDYIEHLRAVHFALIIAAITAVLISFSPDTEDLRLAQRQLAQITQSAKNFQDELKDERNLDKINDWAIFTVGDHKYAAPANWDYLLVKVKPGCTPVLSPPAPSWRPARSIGNGVTVRGFFSSFDDIDDLEAYQDLWALMRCSDVNEYSVSRATALVVQQTSTKDNQVHAVQIPYQHSSELGSTLRKVGYELIDWDFLLMPEGNSGSLQETTLSFVPPFIPEPVSPKNLDALRGDVSEAKVFWPLQRSAAPSTGPLLRRFPEELLVGDCTKPLVECFPELRDSVRTRANYKFGELKEALNWDLEHQEKKQFELFGIKAPAAAQSYLGIAAILVILLYFWLHLRELSPRLEADHSGLDVAWIGLYGSPMAHAVFWLSVLLLPLTAIVLLGLRGSHYHALENATQFYLWLLGPGAICSVLAIWCCVVTRRLALLALVARKADDVAAAEKRKAAGAAEEV